MLTMITSQVDSMNQQRPISPRFIKYESWVMVFIAWLYLTLTQCHGLMWFDSGELALAGHTWGLGHPPGQAFFALLSALTTLSSDPLWLLNHISVLSIALTLLPLSLLFRHINKSLVGQENRIYRDWMIKLIISICWVMLYPVWDQGTRIEVYALGNLLGLSGLAVLTLYAQMKRYLWLAGLFLGVCGATQAVFAVGFTIAGGGVYLIWLRQRMWFNFIHLAMGMMIGFTLPHLYMLWSVVYSDGFIWGNWLTWSDVLRYFSGGDYVGNEHAWSLVIGNTTKWLFWFGAQGGSVWLILSVIGLVVVWRTHLIWWCMCLFFLVGVFPLTYQRYWPEIPDFSGYLLPCLSLSLIVLWSVMVRMMNHLLLTSLMAILIFSSFWGERPLWERSRTTHSLPLDMAKDWLNRLPKNSALFVESDHWVFPLMYAQTVLKIRPDVLVFNVGFVRSSWYWRWLARQHKDLPTLEELSDQRGQRSRLGALALSSNQVFTESYALALNLSQQTPFMIGQPCLSAWGFSVSCQSSTFSLNADVLRSWAQKQAHQDQISKRVLARLGFQLFQHLWFQKKTIEALSFGFASMGRIVPVSLIQSAEWWPVPLKVWDAAQVDLIGHPITLEALMYALAGGQ